MPDKPANSPAGPQEGTRTTAGAAAGTCGLRVPSAPNERERDLVTGMKRAYGLLSSRAWHNDNVWAAEQILRDNLDRYERESQA